MLARLCPLFMIAALWAAPAQAACFADYKAKQDGPLRLHYGVMELPDAACSRAAATQQVRARLQAAGWTLLDLMSVFGAEGLDERKANAGAYFLRF